MQKLGLTYLELTESLIVSVRGDPGCLYAAITQEVIPNIFNFYSPTPFSFTLCMIEKMGYIVSVGRGQIIYGFQRLYFTTSDVLDNNL